MIAETRTWLGQPHAAARVQAIRAARAVQVRDIMPPVPPAPPPPTARRLEPGFRKSFVAAPSGRIGVAVLCFNSLKDVAANVPTILPHLRDDYDFLVFDNSENEEIAEWVSAHAPGAAYIHSRRNVGCWNARNRIAEWSASKGHALCLIQDQDVAWVSDAVAPMAEVFRRYPDTGCVTWQLAVQQMVGTHKRDATGALTPSQSPGMCCMFSIAALAAGDDPDLIGWYPGYGLCYRGDSDVCFALMTKGYKTRVVLDGKGAVRHDEPHRGVAKLGKQLAVEQAFSQSVFDARRAKYGWPRV